MWKLALSCSLCPASNCPCFPLQAVIVCIRNKEFDKATDIVKKHMGKEPRNQVSPCWNEVGAGVSWGVLGRGGQNGNNLSGVLVPQYCMFGSSPWSPLCHAPFPTHLHGPSRHHHLSLDEPPAHLQSRFWEQREFPFLFLQAVGCLSTRSKENS